MKPVHDKFNKSRLNTVKSSSEKISEKCLVHSYEGNVHGARLIMKTVCDCWACRVAKSERLSALDLADEGCV
jgi:hypothetical protein